MWDNLALLVRFLISNELVFRQCRYYANPANPCHRLNVNKASSRFLLPILQSLYILEILCPNHPKVLTLKEDGSEA